MTISITLIIIVVTCIVSFTAFSNDKVFDELIFYPPAITYQKQFYRFFTCGFIHANYGHLLFNMYALYLFGTGVENRFMEIFGDKGRIIYLAMYVLALGASLLPTYSKNKANYHYRSLGASGAVSAVVFAYMLFDPLIGIGLFLYPFTLQDFYLVFYTS